MGGMEFNKIFAALLVAGIIASFSGFVAKELSHPHELHEFSYPIEGLEGPVGGGAGAPQLPEPILAMIGGVDVAKGEKLSRACAACHTFNKGGPNGTGPNLWNVMNRGVGKDSSFAYSGVMAEHGGQWDYLMLNKFLWKPKKTMEGTKMNYIGIKKPEDRAAMIAWLRTLSDSPVGLPSDAAILEEAKELEPMNIENHDDGTGANADEGAEHTENLNE
jgi:cytochrome c